VADVFADARSVMRGAARAALVPAAAVAVHQLRYLLAFGGNAGAELADQGHSYLHSLVPWIVVLIGVGAGAFLWALGRALSGQTSPRRYTLSLAGLWASCAATLLAIYVAQEFLEGVFAAGHPAGLAGIFGHGGWWAIPAAACVGLVLASILHGARWVLQVATARNLRVLRLRATRCVRPRGARAVMASAVPALASGWSRRGPPS
jgi:hypothetical protein